MLIFVAVVYFMEKPSFALLKELKNNSKMKVKIVNKSKHPLPQYATVASAGFDVRANIDSPMVLKTMQRALVPTGLFIELPEGHEAQVRPRSGLALKHGITVF